MSPLLDLPTELLLLLVAYFRVNRSRDVKSLSALSRSSRRLRDIVQPILFEQFEIHDLDDGFRLANQKPMLLFARAIAERPELAAKVKLLHFETMGHEDDSLCAMNLERPALKSQLAVRPANYSALHWEQQIERGSLYEMITLIIILTPNLEFLYFQPTHKLPYELLESLESVYQDQPSTSTLLRALQELHISFSEHKFLNRSREEDALRYNEVPAHNLADWSSMLALPNLQYFKGCNFVASSQNEYGRPLSFLPNSLNISVLELQSCCISAECLRVLLNALKSLKRFSFQSENESYEDDDQFTPRELCLALETQKTSLEYLYVDFRGNTYYRTGDEDEEESTQLNTFPRLQCLSNVRYLCLEYRRLPCLKDLPTCLEYLALKMCPEISDDRFEELMNMREWYPLLKEVFIETPSEAVTSYPYNWEFKAYEGAQGERYVIFPDLDYDVYIGPERLSSRPLSKLGEPLPPLFVRCAEV